MKQAVLQISSVWGSAWRWTRIRSYRLAEFIYESYSSVHLINTLRIILVGLVAAALVQLVIGSDVVSREFLGIQIKALDQGLVLLLMFAVMILPWLIINPLWIAVTVMAMMLSIVTWEVWFRSRRMGLSPTDMLLWLGVLLIFAHQSYRLDWRRTALHSITSVALAYYIIVAGIVPTIYAVYYVGINPPNVWRVTSVFQCWLLYYIIAALAKDAKGLRIVLNSVITLGIVTAIATALQSAFAQQLSWFRYIFIGIVSMEEQGGVIRVMPPGLLLMVLAFCICYYMYIHASSHAGAARMLGFCLVLTVGMIITMTRHVWLGAFITFVVVSISGGFKGITKAVALLAMGIAFLMVFSTVYKSTSVLASKDVFSSIVDRFEVTKMEDPLSRRGSLGDRVREIDLMRPQWEKSKLLGIGVGKPYSYKGQYNLAYGRVIKMPYTYVHNMFWAVLGYTGLLGLSGVAVLYFVSLGRGIYIYMVDRNAKYRGMTLCSVVTLFAFGVSTLVQPLVFEPNSVLVMSLCLAIPEVTHVVNKQMRAVTSS